MKTKCQEACDRNWIQNHPLMQELPFICDFYKSLSFTCFLFLPVGARVMVNYNSYLYESLSGTISSIYDIVKKGHLNDACILLRAYFDTILTAVYIDVIRDEQFDVFNNFVVKEVDEWLQAKYRIPSVRKLLSIIKSNDKTKDVYIIVNKDDKLKKFRDMLDDCVHGNRYRFFLFNCSDIYVEQREHFLNKIHKILLSLFTFHLSMLFSYNPHYLMASDYRDCLDLGLSPEPGSEYWIAPFAQEAFDKYIKPNRELANYIYENCSLEIRR